MAEDWQELAAAAALETDTVRLRFLINQLIHALGQEQERLRKEIQNRLNYAASQPDAASQSSDEHEAA